MNATTETGQTLRGTAFVSLGLGFAAVRDASAAMLRDDDDAAAAYLDEAIASLQAARRLL